MIGLTEHIREIARALLGKENQGLSTRSQLRFGTHGSLAVEIEGKRAGQWYDHETEEGGGLIELVCREKGFANGEAFDWLHDELGIGDGRRYRVTGTWIYRDRNGEPLFRVIRRDCEGKPKKIHQERYDPASKSYAAGKGCMKGVRLVPYRLPDWLDKDAPILIVEGERKVDALFKLGFLATCNPGGAGKFNRGFAPYFQNRALVLMPDNDEAGRKHAREVAGILQPVAASIRMLELSGLPPKGDVIDWVAADGTAERLWALIETAPPYTPQRNTARPQHSPAPEEEEEPAEPEEEDEFTRAAARLAQLPPHEYDRERKAEAKRLNVRTATLDAAVKAIRSSDRNDSAIKGKALVLPEPVPWVEPVEGAELIAGLVEQVRHYVVLPDHAALAAALWVIHAHAHDAAFHSPRLVITSPTMRCGKSTLLRVIGRLVPRPLATANITPAALFRVIEAAKPTLLIDEADSFARDNEELRGIVNSSHCVLDAFVVRAVPAGDDYEARRFSTWAPMAIASIGKVASTIADRSIVLAMERKPPGQTVARMRGDRDDGFGVIASKAARWVADHLEALRNADPDVPPALNDRQCDNWRGPLSIADLCGGDWPTQARAAAMALSVTDEDADTIGVQLLAAIREVFADDKTAVISTDNLLKHLHAMSEAPWGEYGRQRKPITARQLASMLRPFGIVSGTVRVGNDTPKGYKRAQFVEGWSRYATTPQPKESAAFDDFSSATPDPEVADRKRPIPAETATCGGVADSEPLPGQEVACDHCGEPVAPGAPGTTATSGGEHLHNRCVDSWLQR